MLKAHELFGFMTPELAGEIVETTHREDREVYKSILGAVAESRRVRPIFLERKPRQNQYADILDSLVRPRMDAIAGNLLRHWLLKYRTDLVTAFLDGVGVPHENGSIDELPPSVDEGRLVAAIESLLESFPREHVAVYLNAFYEMNEVPWPKLKELLETDQRLFLVV